MKALTTWTRGKSMMTTLTLSPGSPLQPGAPIMPVFP